MKAPRKSMVKEKSNRLQKRKKLAFAVISLGIMGILGCLLLEITLRVTSTRENNATFVLGKKWYPLFPIGVPVEMPSIDHSPDAYRVYSPMLGWSLGPLAKAEEPNYTGGDDKFFYFSNEFGYRCTESEYVEASARFKNASVPTDDPNEYDFVCIGDSFTHGDAVIAEQSWPFLLSKFTGKSVVNLGVGGYGTDQAVMRYEDSSIKSKTVLLGLIAGDLERSTSLVYNFASGGLKSKPIYEFHQSGSKRFNAPAKHGDDLRKEYALGAESKFFSRAVHSWDPRMLRRSLLDFSYVFRLVKSAPVWIESKNARSIYTTDDSRLEYSINIISHLNETALARGADLRVVLLGSLYSFSEKNESRDNWDLFKTKLDESGIGWIDTTDQLFNLYESNPDDVVTKVDGLHYTPEANSLVARIIAESFPSSSLE